MNRKFAIITSLVVLLFVCVAAMEPANKFTEFKNLQVLPKNISEAALNKIMEVDFNKGLGVSCDYCHAKVAGSTDLDMASDAKSEKEAARAMMRMTLDINQKYFGMEHPKIGDSLMTITCMTCHKGEPYPGKK